MSREIVSSFRCFPILQCFHSGVYEPFFALGVQLLVIWDKVAMYQSLPVQSGIHITPGDVQFLRSSLYSHDGKMYVIILWCHNINISSLQKYE